MTSGVWPVEGTCNSLSEENQHYAMVCPLTFVVSGGARNYWHRICLHGYMGLLMDVYLIDESCFLYGNFDNHLEKSAHLITILRNLLQRDGYAPTDRLCYHLPDTR